MDEGAVTCFWEILVGSILSNMIMADKRIE